MGALSDREGWFTLLGLPPGDYVVRATFPNFGAKPRNVVVALGENVPLDFKMIPFGLMETVAVTGVPPLLNTTKTELSTVVTQEEIRASFADGWHIDAIDAAFFETSDARPHVLAWRSSLTRL